MSLHPPSAAALLLALSIAGAAAPSAQAAAPVRTGAAAPAERASLIRGFVIRWGAYVESTYGVDVRTWSSRLVPQFATGDADNLRRAVQRTTYEGAMAELSGTGQRVSDEAVITHLAMQPASADVAPMALGSSTSDLVYTPIQPCRIVDTRSTASGAISANSTRNFFAWGRPNYTEQGGSATDCGLSAESPAAVAINVTAVFPTLAGYATVYPYNTTRPGTASVNYTAGSIINNSIIAQLAPGAPLFDLSIYSYAQSDYVVDIVGYFDAPHATALDCQDVTSVLDVAAAARVSAAPSCPSGYTPTGGGARAAANDDLFINASAPSSVNGNSWFTSVQNQGGLTKSVTFTTRCCRVPGR